MIWAIMPDLAIARRLLRFPLDLLDLREGEVHVSLVLLGGAALLGAFWVFVARLLE